MMRALYAGVMGLRAHQVRMDVIGNNIANVNTTAFKASRVNFSDMYNQTLGGAASPTATTGGVNPKQVGQGVGVSSIDVITTGGSLQATGKVTDLAIAGEGFFVLKEGGRFNYTRAGNFDFDEQGNLVNPSTGQRVQGWLPNAAGTFPTRDASTIGDVKINKTDNVLAKATTKISFDQALNAASPLGTVHTAAATVIDSLGTKHTVTLSLTKVANNAWDITAKDENGAPIPLTNTYSAGATTAPAPAVGTARIQFNSDGSLMDDDAITTNTPVQLALAYPVANGAVNPVNAKIDLSKVIQPALTGDVDTSSLRWLESDGYTTGTLTGISIDSRGVATGYYSNGTFRDIAQVAMANFANPAGLNKEAGNNWSESTNSGLALIGAAEEGGRGAIASNNLEMSNVDLSAEFTNMIVTQRGFQANSRIITTADEMLQEIVALKR